MTYLPDVNVWIALASEKHVHHTAAKQWFAGLTEEKLVFCRVTQLGFLRLLTNHHVMKDEVIDPEGAWQVYRTFRADRRIGFANEPIALGEFWQDFTVGTMVSPNLWTDAYLCALAKAIGSTLVTFDKRIPDDQVFVLKRS